MRTDGKAKRGQERKVDDHLGRYEGDGEQHISKKRRISMRMSDNASIDHSKNASSHGFGQKRPCFDDLAQVVRKRFQVNSVMLLLCSCYVFNLSCR